MLRLSRIVIILAVAGCTVNPHRQKKSDFRLTKNMAFKEVHVTVRSHRELILNVSDLPKFNFVQVLTETGVFVISHIKEDSLLVLREDNAIQMDTVKDPLGPFREGYKIGLILGNKHNNDPSDISMHGHAAYDIVVKK